ncbi:MAG: DNA replication and repair protein RecF [SAR324 cluster bacterium]|nr:DNA replication and repair protein RecF [SAR324 cluster bacterium]
MVIREFACVNFRNYQELLLNFSDGFNFFFGENGQGKSNLVEAIYFALQLESFRTNRLRPLIKKQETISLLRAEIEKDGISRKTRIEISSAGRKVWLDDVSVKRASEYVTEFYGVVFNPESLYLYRRFASVRRSLFDRVLSIGSPEYLEDIRAFRIVLSQKNRLLKQRDSSSLDVWNSLFVEKGHGIIEKREKFSQTINELLPACYEKLSGRAGGLVLDYHPSLRGDRNAMIKEVASLAERELLAGYALRGPHRDDFRMSLGGQSGEEMFSQGEFRISHLAVKMALAAVIGDTMGSLPVVILDDPLSELDATVSDHILQYLFEIPNQIFLTATHPLPRVEAQAARIMEIREGRVS